MSLSVLVVEDDAFTRATLSAALERTGFAVHQPALDMASAVASFQSHNHDVLLTDLDLGSGPSGIDLASQLRILKSNLGVVLLTSYEDPRLHRQSENWLPGGTSYLVKQTLVDLNVLKTKILESIEAASKFEQQHSQNKIPNFTAIQIETMQLLASGLSNVEISKVRGVTEAAVEKTIKGVAEKLQLAPDASKNMRVSITRAYIKMTGGKL